MKKQYIRIEPRTEERLEEIYKIAENMGYKRSDYYEYDLGGANIVILDEGGFYYQDGIEFIEKDKYTELKLEQEFVRGEKVLVRDEYNESWDELIYLTTIEGAIYPYKVVSGCYEEHFERGETFKTEGYKQIKKIKKEIEIKIKDGQTISITKEKAIELGFKI